MDEIMSKGIEDMVSKIKSLEARCEQIERENDALKAERTRRSNLLIMQSQAITLAHCIASTAPVDKAICEALDGVIDGAKERLEQFATEQRAKGIEDAVKELEFRSYGKNCKSYCYSDSLLSYADELRTNAGGK